MLPLSFKEFLNFYEFTVDVTMDEKFQKYLQFGGMPILREFKFNEARSNQALEGIYSTVILRDILQRNRGADEATLQKLCCFYVPVLAVLFLQIALAMFSLMRAIFTLESREI